MADDLFGDGEVHDEDETLSVNPQYASAYTIWRNKEELQKLKDRYGEADDSSDSSSEVEDDLARDITIEAEKSFLKALGSLKARDTKIYDKEANFNALTNQSMVKAIRQPVKQKPLTLKSYEALVVTEKDGLLSEDEDYVSSARRECAPGSYAAQQRELKDQLVKAIGTLSDDEESGDLLVPRKKSTAEEKKESDDYLEWLKGTKPSLDDESEEKDLKPLRDYWNDPNLEDDEKFLRDYILNRRYRDVTDDDRIPTYDEIVALEDEDIEDDRADEFERKYNHRFEEPDPEFIKTYPRTLGESLRRTDDRRKVIREAHKARKDEERQKVREEIKQLKNLKRKEIMEKIEQIHKITGSSEMPVTEEDLEADFDPTEYDLKMKKVFNDDYYQVGADDEKPIFSDSDPDEAYDEWEVGSLDAGDSEPSEGADQDLDSPKEATLISSMTKKMKAQEAIKEMISRKKPRKQSTFAVAVKRKKPRFEPYEKSFQEYFDEYYALDYEDIIGDQPVRFKYRSVIPNDFGLTTDEILRAKDKELNAWVGLKRTVQYRSEHDEKRDVEIFRNKPVTKKKKVLASVFETRPKAGLPEASPSADASLTTLNVSKKRGRKRKAKFNDQDSNSKTLEMQSKEGRDESPHVPVKLGKIDVSDTSNIATNGITGQQPSKWKRMSAKARKRAKKRAEMEMNRLEGDKSCEHFDVNSAISEKTPAISVKSNAQSGQTKKVETVAGQKGSKNSSKMFPVKRKSKKRRKSSLANPPPISAEASLVQKLSDERLAAYGLNPKKMKNKAKYRKQHKNLEEV